MPSDLSFMKGLFLGHLRPELVHPYPRQDSAEAETTRMVVESFRAFAREHVDGAAFDRAHGVPASVRRGLAELGVMGLTVPEEYGGAGLGYTTYCRVLEECNRWCGSTAVIMGGHQSIGMKAVLLSGTDEQKRRWLPRLASGEWLAAFALSEPEAGSDPASMTTRADETPDGQAYVLTGQKIWCTNGGFADFITVFAKTADEKGERRVTCFVLTPEEMQHGFRRGAEEHKLGLRGSSTTQLFLDGVRVPRSHVLGQPGRGLKVALEVLNYGRASLAAGCAGSSKRMLLEASRHARERVQFGRPIVEFELIQAKLAEMAADTYATEALAYLTVGMADRGDADFSVEAATCKVFGTEACWRTCNHAVQIAGGIAYVEDYPYERFLRDARINMIFEGTNEILHHFIAMSGLREPAGLVRETGSCAGARGPGGRFDGLHEAIRDEVRPLEEAVPALGAAVERALRQHGAAIERRQLVQARLAEAAMCLYAGFACASRVDDALRERGPAACANELDVARLATRGAVARVRRALDALDDADDDLTRTVAMGSERSSWLGQENRL
jgi:acyl-CoA dehydrogenase family protein 9